MSKIPMHKWGVGDAAKWVAVSMFFVAVLVLSFYMRRCEMQFWMDQL